MWATHVHQNVHQRCTFSARSVLGWFSVSFISLFLTVISDCPTTTYKPEFRPVDPKVEGSSPFGLVAKLCNINNLYRISAFPCPQFSAKWVSQVSKLRNSYYKCNSLWIYSFSVMTAIQTGKKQRPIPPFCTKSIRLINLINPNDYRIYNPVALTTAIVCSKRSPYFVNFLSLWYY